MTVQLEHSQCPLVEINCIASLFYVSTDTTAPPERSRCPPGGDGFYYFSLFLVVINPKLAYFDLNVNEGTVCTAFTEQTDTPSNDGPTSCTAISYLTEGKGAKMV